MKRQFLNKLITFDGWFWEPSFSVRLGGDNHNTMCTNLPLSLSLSLLLSFSLSSLHTHIHVSLISQKWSKGKVRDKLNNLAMFDKVTYDKLYKEVPSYKLITPAVVSERLKIRASLARKALEELESKGLIKEVLKHHAQKIYTRAPKGDEH